MAQVIDAIFQVLYLVILARLILSFIPIDPYSSFYQVKVTLYNITEPILAPFRRILPPIGGLDFSPIILFLLLSVLRNILISAF